MIPTRPHGAPCSCDVCVAWAKEVVGPPGTGLIVRRQAPVVRERSFAEMMQGFIDIAVNATGMSAEELRRLGEETGDALPQVDVDDKPNRDTVLTRGVPELHLEAVYDRDPIECDALVSVCSFLKSNHSLLVLSGGVGTRKTGSACYALVCGPGVFVTAEDLGQIALAKTEKNQEAWNRVRKAQTLIIDDLGLEYLDDKGWFFKVLNGLIDHRYSSKLKSIMTTNIDSNTFKQLYGDRIVDRIREKGRWVNLGGISARRKAG